MLLRLLYQLNCINLSVQLLGNELDDVSRNLSHSMPVSAESSRMDRNEITER
jgi:hypothetical protein